LAVSEIAEALAGLSPEALAGIAALAGALRKRVPESANASEG
jgi:hypothetical protein